MPFDRRPGTDRHVLILGGTGFIGSRIAAHLVSSGWRATVATRRQAHGRHLLPLPSVERVVEADVHDDAALERLVAGHHAVINLIGILHDKPGLSGSRYGQQFARNHVAFPRRLAAECARQGVRHLLHMSALGADVNGPSMYQRSKADGEAAARGQPDVIATVFRPSVVFGPGDRFLNLFARLQRWLPLMLLGGADARFQPVYVEDVAQAFVRVLRDARLAGQTVELAGPHVYTLRELVRLAGRYAGRPRTVLGLPPALARLQALALEWMPGGPLMSRDNLDSMRADNVSTAHDLERLGIRPTPIEAVAPRYLRDWRASSGKPAPR